MNEYLSGILDLSAVPESGFVKFGSSQDGEALNVAVGREVKSVKLSLQDQVSFHLGRVIFIGEDGAEINVKHEGVSVTSSSVYQDNPTFSPENVVLEKGMFHSKNEPSPWLEFRFASPIFVREIIISNAHKKFFFRAYSIKVSVVDEESIETLLHDNWAWMKVVELLLEAQAARMSLEDLAMAKAKLYATYFCENKLKVLLREVSGVKELPAKVESEACKILLKYGYGFTQHGIGRVFASFNANQKKEIAAELADFMGMLKERLGFDSFITSGTLLGFIREQEFLGHDDDLDICYISKCQSELEIIKERETLIGILTGMGYRVQLAKTGTHFQLPLSSGVNLDLFVAFLEEEMISIVPLPRCELRLDTVIPLKTVDAYGVELWAPRDHESCLTLNYGPKWHVHDASWRFDWARALREYGFLR